MVVYLKNTLRFFITATAVFILVSCAPADVPKSGAVSIKPIAPPLDRFKGVNERRDPITRVKLGKDILIPQPIKEDLMPEDLVGPYELRSETLASALQLILDEYDVSIAFESNAAFEKRVSVANLHGKLKDVVNRVCSLANLYCHFEKGNLTIKETETFVVDLPPLGNTASSSSSSSSSSTTTTATTDSGSSGDAYSQIASGLEAVIGSKPTVDSSTRVMIYTATQRTNKYALRYFEKLRKNTALIIFETHIWEVTLNNTNRTGIQWNALFEKVPGGNFKYDMSIPGASGAVSPIAITPAYTGSGRFSTDAVLEFISERGAVKTISQPQITVLSGSSASLNVSQEENFVSGMTRTPSTVVGGADTVSTTTETVKTGLTMDVSSAWDQSTVYGGLSIVLDDLLRITEFNPDVNTTIQLPQTTKRSLTTEIRVRPGDAILIGGLVSEKDDLTDSGPGFMEPLFATSRKAEKKNTELVFLLRPRVVVFDMGDGSDNVPVVDAPKSGVESNLKPVADISDDIDGLFKEDESTLMDLTSKVKNLFKGKSSSNEDSVDKPVEPISDEDLLPVSDSSVNKFGSPVSSPMDLLKSDSAVTINNDAKSNQSKGAVNQ